MTIGKILEDDPIQLFSIALAIASIIVWSMVLYRSTHPGFFLAPIIASGASLVFYVIVIFVPMSTVQATTLSAARTFIDLSMWIISGGTMLYMQRRRKAP